jgi:hypothetical protein
MCTARNVLLLSLIADGESSSSPMKLWNIFFNLKIDQSSLTLLVSQSKKLLGLSEDLEAWHNSDYGTFIRFCTRQTLSDLRQLWEIYGRADNQPADEMSRLRDRFAAALSTDQGNSLSTSRSGGPLLALAMEATDGHFKRFWNVGMVPYDSKRVAAGNNVNPLFAYSLAGDEFAVHYGTDPLAAFHLAAALNLGRRANIHDLINNAMEQFQSWCKTFKDALLTPGKVVVRFFAGDALRFCHALRHLSSPQTQSADLYTSSWRSTRLELDVGAYATDNAPKLFNVIDTSNVIDHVGLMNILIAAAPLVSSYSNSTLYTEALANGDNSPMSFLPRLCGDVTAMSLLLGLAPVSFMSGFASRSTTHEMAMHRYSDSPQCYERVSWKHPSSGDLTAPELCQQRLAFEPVELARFLFAVYLQMFADEDMNTKLRTMSAKSFASSGIIHYVRETFAVFARIVKDKVETDWRLVMNTFVDALTHDRTLLMGPNNAQDLFCQLHVHGVYTVDVIRTWRPVETAGGVFRGWSQVPPLVCVVLVIPRKKLEPLVGFTRCTPILHCELAGPTSHNIFSSIQTSFGTVHVTGTGDSAKAVLTQDDAGWKGTCPIIATFWVPSWVFSSQALIDRVNFSVRSTPFTADLAPKLGWDLALFSARLSDTKQVHVVTERPIMRTVSSHTLTQHPTPSVTSAGKCTVSMGASGTAISTLAVRADISDSKAKMDLLDGAAVTANQISPCGVAFSINDYTQILWYPWPVDGPHCRVRIARKSHYIEVTSRTHAYVKEMTQLLILQVVVPLFKPVRPGALSILNFPVVFNGGHSTPWNVHRVNLKKLPPIEFSDARTTEMLSAHVSMMFSHQERVMRDQNSLDTLTNIKDALHAILLSAGLRGETKQKVFGLSNSSLGGIDTMIFVTELRLDLGSHTVIADACVLPLSPELLANNPLLRNRLAQSKVYVIETSEAVGEAWKRLIPAWVERCRRWKHADNCAYYSFGKGAPTIPISTKYGTIPICGCGRGQDVDEFKRSFSKWKMFAQLMTRMAISPLFFVSYMDRLGGRLPTEPSVVTTRPLPFAKVASDKCATCKGEGKPKLLLCSKCKQIQYCSPTCQKADWKEHKKDCGQN